MLEGCVCAGDKEKAEPLVRFYGTESPCFIPAKWPAHNAGQRVAKGRSAIA